LKLCAYLIGEFGYQLPDSIPPRAKFEALEKHFSKDATSNETQAILIVAVVKLLNSNPDQLQKEVKHFLEDLVDQQDVEIQQRACELFALSQDDKLLDEVLDMMPVYAEAVQANNPLIQRLKFQNKSRAHTRAELEHAAKSEGGVYKRGARPKDAVSPRGASSDSNQLALGDAPRGTSKDEEDEDAASESEEEDSDEEQQAEQGAKELWQKLCITSQGNFYISKNLCLDLRQEYSQSQGRIQILYRSKEPVSNIRVTLQDTPHLRFKQDSQAPRAVSPGESHVHTIQLQCLQPFLPPARYLLEYVDAKGQIEQLPLMLPAVFTKFVTPVQGMPMQTFRQHYESFNGPGQEGQVVGAAKFPPNQWPQYLSTGFNMYALQECDQSNAFAVGTFWTGTPDPTNPGKTMSVPCMVKLDFEPNKRMIRITVRTQHGAATSPLLKILETYMTEMRR